MTKKERYAGVIAYFEAQVTTPETELLYENPFQLLVAVILSAQCTDKRVNLTTPSIFAKFPTPQKMAKASFDDMFALIKSISYPSSTKSSTPEHAEKATMALKTVILMNACMVYLFTYYFNYNFPVAFK